MSEKRMRITVGEAIVKFLDNQYVTLDGVEEKFVEGVFTVFGHGCVLGIGEALAMAEHTLKIYQGKNEQGMAHVAIAYAKQNNRKKIIPCISSIGPGAANMVTAAATATVNNIPLLLFPGDSFSTRRPDPVLQQIEQSYDLNITTNDAFKPVTKFFDRITRPEMLETALLNAMRVLTDPAETGAVCIALPQDVQAEVYNFPKYLFEKRVHRIERPVPSIEQMEEAVSAIARSRYPMIIVGGGARYSEAGRTIAEFCDRHNIPFAETQAGKSTLPSASKYYLGGLGVTGNSCANVIAMRSDCIIALGTRLSDFTTASKTLFHDASIVSINTSKFHSKKMNAVSVVGDVKATLLQLKSRLTGYYTYYQDEYKTSQMEWKAEMRRLKSIQYSKELVPEVLNMTKTTVEDFRSVTGAEICQTTAIGIIRDSIATDAIIIGASGSLPGCLQRMWETDYPNSYNMEYGYSCMGHEISGALGCKIASPHQEVYAMVGDGSYLMLHSELVTAVQEGKKINVLLFDNGGFGCINNLQMGKGSDSLATEFRYGAKAKTKFLNIDYAANARAYGCKGYTVKTEQELREALESAKADTCPVLIDIKVLPKTMTDGYEGGFWQVGCNFMPRNKKQEQALAEQLHYVGDRDLMQISVETDINKKI
ncbi:MAG: 3D-(3,5/4)-trihydroxycyclohexane-1,2-dione acylhydrolase (decyclizing) [Clostridia bacterium]